MDETEIFEVNQISCEISSKNEIEMKSNLIETEQTDNAINSNLINDDISDNFKQEDLYLFRLEFRDEAIFNELQQTLIKCVRDTLFGMKKSLNIVVNDDRKQIEFFEIANNNDDTIFMVDTYPMAENEEIKAKIPEYHPSEFDVLNDTIDIEQKDDNAQHEVNKMKIGTCWNCNGDHTLRDCKEPRDSDAINRNKQMFTQKTKTERYHLDSDQKYKHLMPGIISDNLREALGLRSRELPAFFYIMRRYGYPPGWLEEAKISHSGMSLFTNDDGSNEKDNENEMEEITFDPSKLIEFPGFNAPLPPHIIDESDYYNVPRMRYEDSIDGLSELFRHNLVKKYKRKRQKRDVDGEPIDNLKSDDMDVATTDDESPESPSTVENSEPQPGPEENSASSTCVDNTLEASLTELQRRQKELENELKALAEIDPSNDQNEQNASPASPVIESSPASPDEIIDSNVQQNGTTVTKVVYDIELNETIKTTTTDDNIQCSTESSSASISKNLPSTPQGHSKGSLSGTPLIKQVSPYSRLPGGEAWSVGVTDVIDFENLPDSTGTYQKLNNVLRRVRTFVKNTNEANDDDS